MYMVIIISMHRVNDLIRMNARARIGAEAVVRFLVSFRAAPGKNQVQAITQNFTY
jgi:hypothetical protein